MTVLHDAYTSPREELSRIETLRSGEPHRPGQPTRGSLQDHAPDLQDVVGSHELHTQAPRSETEPHGMYWQSDANGHQRLYPHKWFIQHVAVQANSIFQLTRESIGTDQSVIEMYQHLGDSLRTYIEWRTELNEMVRERKFRQELDDAAYQFCQAAKYKTDAEERAKFLVERDEDALDNEQINQLISRAEQAAHEGFVLAYAIRHAGFAQPMNFEASAKRVLDYSCRRLTEWFAQRRKNTQNQRQLTVTATMTLINNTFLRRTR